MGGVRLLIACALVASVAAVVRPVRTAADPVTLLGSHLLVTWYGLVLDVQPGRAQVADEVAYLRPFLSEPDVHLAFDPEFAMLDGQVPGRTIGHLHAADINAALDVVESIVAGRALPPKVVIVHQFTLGMLPDKGKIRSRTGIDLVLDMDGFGPQSLKHASYRAVMRQQPLPFAGFKLFYRQDTNLLSPSQVLRLKPVPSVVIYQ